MSGFIDLMGGLGAAYNGYQRGADAELERQQKAARDEAERRRLSDEAAMAPLAAQARRAQLQAQIDQAEAEADLAPTRRDIARRSARAEADLLDGKIKLAKGDQDAALRKQTFDAIIQAQGGVEGMARAQDSIMAIAGRQLAAGNYNGLTQVLSQVIDSPLIPSWQSLGKPVKTELGAPPAGAQDMTGQEAQPNALKITFEDGSVQWLNSGPLAEAYRQQRNAQYKPIISKPGEVARDPLTGRKLWENDPLPPKGWIRNEQGDLEFIGGGVGGGSTGAGGRAGKAADPLKGANDAWELVATKSDTKLPPEVNARGARLTQQLVSENPNLPASVAAEAALAVAQDPDKAVPSINMQTGRIDEVYISKAGGDLVINRGVASAANPGDVTPDQMKTAVKRLLDDMSEGDRKILRDAAFNPEKRKKFLEDANKKIDETVKKDIAAYPAQEDAIRANAEAVRHSTMVTLGEKLELVSRYGSRPKEDKGGRSMVQRLGGITGREAAAADPNSPAGRAQARQREMREEAAAREQQKQERATELGAQFQRDKAAMSPLDLARKYDELRGQLPTKDAAELQQIERTIR